MRRFFIAEPQQEEMTIVGTDAHHILHVLRCRCGSTLVIVDSERRVAAAEITELGADFVRVRRTGQLEADTEPPIAVTLAQCLPKADKMDFIVQKAVELGVYRICPVASENCVVKYDAAKREARWKKWQRIACEAAKQCGRTALPEVAPIAALTDFLANVEAEETAFFCYEGAADGAIGDLLTASHSRRFVVLIGPEGGFSPAEAALCRARGLRAVTLGPRVLRTETAALAALSVVMYQNGDLNGRG